MSAGPQGLTGPQGLQGRRGKVGVAVGPTGPTYATAPSSNVTLSIATPTNSNITLDLVGYGKVYNITPLASTGTLTVTFPTITENFPVPEQQGRPWVFHNNCGTSITITFVGGTITYLGDSFATQFYLAIGQSISITYGGAAAGTSYIAY
jgi:hypothetical protein